MRQYFTDRQYKYVISLGHFCSPALTIESLGLRDSSMPFDWLIEPWESVEKLINNHFDGFLESSNMLQDAKNRNYYFDAKYKIWFCHDFNGYHSLNEQINAVVEKYQRRIVKFYASIVEPTLFIRYIEGINELTYLEKNYDYVMAMLQQFNVANNIIFICNDDITYSSSIPIYYVKKDKNDAVARKPQKNNCDLLNFLQSNIYDKNKRKSNLLFYLKKKYSVKKWVFKFKYKVDRLIRKPYVHSDIFQDDA